MIGTSTIRQASTRCTTTESNTLAVNDNRKHLIIQNSHGGNVYLNFDSDATPDIDDCSLELIDLEIIQIPNFTGSVKTSGDGNVKIRFMEFA